MYHKSTTPTRLMGKALPARDGGRVPGALGDLGNEVVELGGGELDGAAGLGGAVGGHQQLGHHQAVVEGLVRLAAGGERLPHVPVLVGVAVAVSLVGEDPPQAG